MVGTSTLIFPNGGKIFGLNLKKDNVLLAVLCSLADSSFATLCVVSFTQNLSRTSL